MNQAQKRAVNYVRTLNDVVDKTQETQKKLNKQFEVIKKAMNDGTLKDMKSADYLSIQGEFQSGTDEYAKLADRLSNAKAPAKLFGINLSLVQSYRDYVKSCQAMIDSMKDDRTVDKAAFEQSENDQDVASAEMTKHILKMNSLY